MTNCPNCGAPIVADQCAYCGTMFRDRRKELIDDNAAIPIWHSPVSLVQAYSQGEIVNYRGELRRSLINRNVYSPEHDSVWQSVELV